jgi:enterobacterial common antigen flippase
MPEGQQKDNSYPRILKSSSLIGGAQGINMLVGMVRVKCIALLIGPAGVGLLGMYLSITSLVGTLAGLGIQSSGVRDVAEAFGTKDQEKFGRTILTLRRICWLTGSVGGMMLVLFAFPLSKMTFDSSDYTLPIASLGLMILFGNIQEGQIALIQGTRRIGDLAKLNILGSTVGSVVSVSFYYFWGLKGIVPALLSLSLFNLLASWRYARKIEVPVVMMKWADSIKEAGGMVRLGIVFMWNGLLLAMVAYITRILIVRELDVAAVGIFTSAFNLSGMMVDFVLGAMGADYYPSLTALSRDKIKMCRLVNEQTEIGLLLAAPGLLFTIILAPYIVNIFYSSEFFRSVDLLQWFVLGCLGRIISWPMGFVMLALGEARLFGLTETAANIIHIFLVWSLLMLIGIKGVAIAFFLLYVIYTLMMIIISRYLIGFSWSSGVVNLLSFILPLITGVFLVSKFLPIIPATGIGTVVSLFTSFYCLRELLKRLGPDHRIGRIVKKIPLLHRLVQQ